MRLKLTIIEPDISTGVRKEITFEQQGGIIGRNESNDWVLPDIKRFISSKHAVVQFENNDFLLGDLSTNGVYLNNATSPIGNGNFVTLNSGDQFKIGEYNILASVEDMPVVTFDVPDVSGVVSESNAYDLSGIDIFPEDMDPLALLDESTNKSKLLSGAAHRQASLDSAPIGQDYFQPPQFESAVDDANVIPTNWAELSNPEQSSAAVFKDHSPESSVNKMAHGGVPSPENSQLSNAAINSFFKGIGMPPEALGHSDMNAVMFDFGQVLRTIVQCLMEILSARANLKSEFRMSYTAIRVKENNPLKFSINIDDALNNLFLKTGDDYLKPKEAIGEAVDNLKDHQIALLAGMRAALGDIVDKFDPVIVERDMEKYKELSSKISVYRKAKSWDIYCENYNNLKQNMGDDFQAMFGSAFIDAYEKQISDLSLGRKK